MAIVVKVSDDRMEAIVTVDRQDDSPIDADILKRALADARITHGIQEDVFNELVSAVNAPWSWKSIAPESVSVPTGFRM